MDVIQAKLTNEFLSVQNYSIDWVAWIALAVSILATIGTLWWQNRIRKKDLERIREEKKADDKARKWAAEYPYKLQVFTNFYDIVNSVKVMEIGSFKASDLQSLVRRLLNVLQQADLFFSSRIKDRIQNFYDELNIFFITPLDYSQDSFCELYNSGYLDSRRMKESVEKNFYCVKEHADVIIQDKQFKADFVKELQMPKD